MAILLGDSVDANFTLTTSSYTAANGECGYLVTAPFNGTVDTLKIRINTSATAANWRLMVRSTEGVMLANATVAAGENLTRTVSVTPFVVVAGTQYRLTFVVNTGSPRPYQNAVQNTVAIDTSSTYAAPETIFIADSIPSSLRQFQMWAEGETTQLYTITSVNGDDEINPGEVNTAEVVGYVAGVNPVVSGVVGSLALVDVSQSITTVSFTPPTPVNAAYWPEPDTTQTLTLTDGDNPATFEALFSSLDGYNSVLLVSPDNVDQHKIPYWLTTLAVDDDRLMSTMTLAADGSITDGPLNGTVTVYHWVALSSLIYEYSFLLSDGEITAGNSITAVGVTMVGITMTGLTAVGL